MFQLPSALRIVLELAVALGLGPLAFACLTGAWALRSTAFGSRRGEWLTIGVVSCILPVWLASAFVLSNLSREPRIESPVGALAVARAAQLGRWPMSPTIESAIRSMRAQPEMRTFGDLLAIVAGQRSPAGDLRDTLFAAGAPLHEVRPPFATWEGWTVHDLGAPRCLVIVYFRPAAPLDGRRVWLHEYPEHGHEYSDVSLAMPAAEWRPGELGWEVFRSSGSRRFSLYAGIESGGDLGPAVLLGAVDGCHPFR